MTRQSLSFEMLHIESEEKLRCDLKINELDINCSLLNPSFPDYLIFREQLNILTKSKNYPDGLLIDDEDFEDEMQDE